MWLIAFSERISFRAFNTQSATTLGEVKLIISSQGSAGKH